MLFESNRLIFRKLTPSDFDALCVMLQDIKVMYAYEHAFSDQEVVDWINRQLERYQTYGIGLWACILKETGQLVGQCGLTPQIFNDQQVIEIGYLFNAAVWHQGLATEAAIACKNYAFNVLDLSAVYSIIRDTNSASIAVAKRCGMLQVGSIVKHYYNLEMPHLVYSVQR